MILELAILGLAAASDAEETPATSRIEAVNRARTDCGIPAMDEEETFAFLMEESTPSRQWCTVVFSVPERPFEYQCGIYQIGPILRGSPNVASVSIRHVFDKRFESQSEAYKLSDQLARSLYIAPWQSSPEHGPHGHLGRLQWRQLWGEEP